MSTVEVSDESSDAESLCIIEDDKESHNKDENAPSQEENMLADENDYFDVVFDKMKLFSCFHCDNKFIRYRDLDCHIKRTPIKELEMSLEKNALKVFQDLDISTEVNSPVQNNKKLEYTSDKKSFHHHCPLCNYSSPRMNQMKSHILIMHTDVRPYKCSLCDYKCINRHKLRLHVTAIHTKEKPHTCTLCDYKGTRASHLKRHVMKYHKDNSPFKCKICNFNAMSPFLLKRHMKLEHDD